MKVRKNSRVPLYILLLIPFFELQSLDNMVMIGFQESIWNLILNIFSVARLGITLFVIIDSLFHRRIRKEPVIIGVTLFVLCENISSMANGSWFVNFTVGTLSNIGLILLCRKMAQKAQKDFVVASELLFGIYSILGAVSIICFPYGFFRAADKAYAIYFLGAKNTSVLYWWIFLLIISVEHAKDKKFPLWILIMDLFFAYAAYVAESANSLIVLFLLLILFVVLRWKSIIYKLFSPGKLMIVLAVGASVILVPNLRNLLEPIVVAFGRNMDFTGRTILWEQAVSGFLEKPIFGNGIFIDFILINKAIVDHAHCYYLDLLAKYGLLTFTAFVVEITLFFCQFIKKNLRNRKIIAIGSFFVFAMLVHSIMENLTVYQWIFCLGFLTFVDLEEPNSKRGRKIKHIYSTR